MTKYYFLLFCFFWSKINAFVNQNEDYGDYHRQVVNIETLIGNEEYSQALTAYQQLFTQYNFIFQRDYKLATQLAIQLNKIDLANELLINGIQAGWSLKSIRKNSYLKPIRKSPKWKAIKKKYPEWRAAYEAGLNQNLQKRVKELFRRDQWMALKALFRIGEKMQQRYSEKKFAPHSERQVLESFQIIHEYGYPGERLTGNNYWMSTILSHHNSISTSFNKKDTLYQSIKPTLEQEVELGNMSAFEFVLTDEWYRASTKQPTYAIIDGTERTNLNAVNERRASVYLRPAEVHNKLVELEKKTGMNFYLNGHPWDKHKIEIRN